MAFTKEQLVLLEESIAQGALQVKYQDKEVRYQSLQDMLILRDIIRRTLKMSKVEKQRIRARFLKGL
jgi:hypothetical protein